MSLSLQFVLRHSSEAAVFQHLALYSSTHQLTHWVLPGQAQRLLDGHPYYLLVESPVSSPLPPHEIDTGECTLAGRQLETPTDTLHHRLQTGHLSLHLQGKELRGAFTLTRLGPDSHIWRFSVGHPVPQSVAVQA